MKWRLLAGFNICSTSKLFEQMINDQPLYELQSCYVVYSYTHYVMQCISERIYLLIWSINLLFSQRQRVYSRLYKNLPLELSLMQFNTAPSSVPYFHKLHSIRYIILLPHTLWCSKTPFSQSGTFLPIFCVYLLSRMHDICNLRHLLDIRPDVRQYVILSIVLLLFSSKDHLGRLALM